MFRVMKATNAEPLEIHGIRLGPELTEEQAKAVFALGEEAVIFALLAQAKSLAEHDGDRSPGSRSDDPSCPSGQKAPYEKPSQTGRKKKPGRKPGHEGHCRAKPGHIDHHEQHRQSHCPECGGTLTKCNVSRKRYIEDIPQDVHVEVTEHTIHRDWCPRCRKMVEPKVPAERLHHAQTTRPQSDQDGGASPADIHHDGKTTASQGLPRRTTLKSYRIRSQNVVTWLRL
jgi:transposase